MSPTRSAFFSLRGPSARSESVYRLRAAFTSERAASSIPPPFDSRSIRSAATPASGPIHGICSSSKIAGYSTSRLRPRCPSARWITRSGGVASIRATNRAGEADSSTRSTS
ncbi:MAG: hypothetical protein R3B70_47300 [Polyangiaceae bacterium]